MQKFVVSYGVGDGCTFSFTEVEAVEYSSKQDLEMHFLDSIMRFLDNEIGYELKIGNVKFDMSYMTEHKFEDPRKNSDYYIKENKSYVWFILPEILTLEEWFEQKLKG